MLILLWLLYLASTVASCKKCTCKPDIIQSSSHPVAAGDLLLPHKFDDSTAQLLRGMKKGMEFIVVNNDRLIQRFARKKLGITWDLSLWKAMSDLDS